MRKKRPERRTKRIRNGFCFLPMEINNETRWFENVKWEEACIYYVSVFDQRKDKGWGWKPIRWIDDKLEAENDELKQGMEQNLRVAQHAEADNKQLRDTVRKADMLFMSLGQVGHILEEVLSIMEEGRLICIAALGDNDGG